MYNKTSGRIVGSIGGSYAGAAAGGTVGGICSFFTAGACAPAIPWFTAGGSIAGRYVGGAAGSWAEDWLMNEGDPEGSRFRETSVDEVGRLRNEFNNGAKSNYLTEYAKTAEANRRFSPSEISRLAKGKVPKGWVVHHKRPLFRGGNNSFGNLRMMRQPIHLRLNKWLHWYKKGSNPYGLN